MSERLDRIEAILVRTAEQIEAVSTRVAASQNSNTRDIEALVEAVSNLDLHIESVANNGQATETRLARLAQLVERNTETIASTAETIASTAEIAANNAKLAADNAASTANNAQQIAESNQRFNLIIQRIDESNQRFDILIAEARADRKEWKARTDAQAQATQALLLQLAQTNTRIDPLE